MSKTQIKMLGLFEIITGGINIVPLLETAKKRVALLQYLILNHDRTIPSSELFSAIWPFDDETADQKGSLKTMVSRLRARLGEFDKNLSDRIVTDSGGYTWQTDPCCSVDCFDFEQLCDRLGGSISNEEKKRICARALSLYRGDLMPESEREPWVVRKSISLRERFLAVVDTYVSALKEHNDFEKIESVCRYALNIDRFNSQLNLEYMNSLVAQGKPNDAVAHYYTIAGNQSKSLCDKPSALILDFYKRLTALDRKSNDDIALIRSELTQKHEPGAFLCDYDVFKEIYNFQRSSAKRLGISIFIVLISLSSFDNMPIETSVLKSSMSQLRSALKQSLRSSDAVAEYNAYQYSLLLSVENIDRAVVAVERAKNAFYELNSHDSVVFSYSIGPIIEA
ncbi:MAG: winged helix-turn-helix domain-containing protein [Oscillospiraceae bacterium]